MSQNLVWILGGGTVVAGAAVVAVIATGLREEATPVDPPFSLVDQLPDTPTPEVAEVPVETSDDPVAAAAPTVDAPDAEPVPAPVAEAPVPELPLFDVVRVARDGQALVAGSAAPGSAVILRVDGAVVAQTAADGAGQFVALFSLGYSDTVQAMTLESQGADGTILASEDTVVLTPRMAPVAMAEVVGEPEASEAPIAMAEVASTEPEVTETTVTETTVAETATAEVPAQAEAPVATAEAPTIEAPIPEAPVSEPPVVADAPAALAEADVGETTAVQPAAQGDEPVQLALADAPDPVAEQVVAETMEQMAAPTDPQPDVQIAEVAPVEALEIIAQGAATAVETVTRAQPAQATATLSPSTQATPEQVAPTETTVAEVTPTQSNVEPVSATTAAVEPPASVTAQPEDVPTELVQDEAPAQGSAPVETALAVSTDRIAAAQPGSSDVIAEAAAPVAEAAPVETAQLVASPTETADTPSAPARTQTQSAQPQAVAQAGAADPVEEPQAAEPQSTQLALAEDMPTAFLVRGSGEVEVLDRAPQVADNVVIDSISYSSQGDVLIAGRAARSEPDSQLRIYLNNQPIAIATAASGDWASDLPDVDPGVYTLRVDQLSDEGQVVSRFETPFQREDPELVIAAQAQTAMASNTTRSNATASMSAASSAETTVSAATVEPVTPTSVQTGVAATQTIATRAETAPASAPTAPPVSLITVQPGHTLWAISNDRYGAGELYVVIYRANRDQIRNPDLIYPGQVFSLPEN